jgi:transcriptional regulator with XRE-family HTH domain
MGATQERDSPLRQRRKALKLRQQDVATAAGCSVSLVSMCESGYKPPIETQERIAAALQSAPEDVW